MHFYHRAPKLWHIGLKMRSNYPDCILIMFFRPELRQFAFLGSFMGLLAGFFPLIRILLDGI